MTMFDHDGLDIYVDDDGGDDKDKLDNYDDDDADRQTQSLCP